MNLRGEDSEARPGRDSSAQRSDHSLDPPKDYEIMVQKLEAEVRSHIRVEQQLKLHIESTQLRTEELEKNEQRHLARIKQLSEV